MIGDVVKEREYLFLASRLKRLAERMQGDVLRVVERAGLSIQAGQYPLLATLDTYGAQTIGSLTEAMEQSQPTVTRAVSRLIEMGLVRVSRIHRDQRHKTVSLTEAGVAALRRSKVAVWAPIEAAVKDISQELSGSLLGQVARLESMLAESPLDERAHRFATAGLKIRQFSDDLADAFRDINAQWIAAMYTLEQTDIDVLDNPSVRIIEPGGDILFVEAAGLGIIGTCALQKTGATSYELTKMGVLASARGCKAGEFLLSAVIARGVEMGADPLYLLTNKKSEAAIHLYEKLGFAHDAEIMHLYGARYTRCDVAMCYKPTH